MKYYFIIFIILLFTLTGCERLRQWDEKIGEIFFSGEPAATTTPFWEDLDSLVKERIASSSRINLDEIDIKQTVSGLNKEQKDKIETWINKEGLNRYGDPADTYYAGGTPLFDEASGETKERFEFILENHKELIEKLGL